MKKVSCFRIVQDFPFRRIQLLATVKNFDLPTQYYLRWSDLPDPEPAAVMFEKRMHNAFARLNRELAARAFVCGDDVTIVDIIAYPMTAMATKDFAVLSDLENLKRWRDTMAQRPAVAKAMSWYADNAPALDKVPDTWTRAMKD